jgi:hypothetical protein
MNKDELIRAENIKKAKKLNLEVINWFLNTDERTPADMWLFFDNLLYCTSMLATVDDDILQKYIPAGMEWKDTMISYKLKELRDLFHKTAIDNGQSLMDAACLEFEFGNMEAKNYQNL